MSAPVPADPSQRPCIRSCAEDFEVEEIPLYRPSGCGAHTFLWIEKRGVTTEAVARELARRAGVAPRDVGYAGRKDRHAVARQWFSVPEVDPAAAPDLPLENARVLEAAAHPHKLRTGQLRGNRFRVTVRRVDAATRARAGARLTQIAQGGLPNAFGAQRFGRDGDNAQRALALLAGRERVRDRRSARFLLSALQASVFNDVLSRRPLPLDALETGDVAWVHASGGVFRVEDVEREAPRAAAFEISATGPIFGSRSLDPTGAPAERERAALRRHGLPETGAPPLPRGLRLRGGRRPLRVRPGALRIEPLDDAVRLHFTLPAGSYATVLLEALFGPLEEALRMTREREPR